MARKGTRVLGVCGGNLQGREWVIRMLGMPTRQVLDGDGGGNVQRVPDAYLLWGGERHDGQLHMQQGLYGGGRRAVCGLPGW